MVYLRYVISGDHERRVSGTVGREKETKDFNNFIHKLNLVDLPLERRKFTWYRVNGNCASRIDRFLLSCGWMELWPTLAQFGLKRKVSDHAEILLKEDVQDWGPRPFKFLSFWIKEKGFKELVENEWKGCKIEGWSGFVLKEKL